MWNTLPAVANQLAQTAMSPQSVSRLGKALSDPIRVQLVNEIAAAEDGVCQCNLRPKARISQSTLSHHLAKLVDAGLVCVERRGKWAWYSICPGGASDLLSWLEGLDEGSLT